MTCWVSTAQALSALRVRAEIEERDIGKLRVGQGAVIRSDAFPNKDFEGKVVVISFIYTSWPILCTRIGESTARLQKVLGDRVAGLEVRDPVEGVMRAGRDAGVTDERVSCLRRHAEPERRA